MATKTRYVVLVEWNDGTRHVYGPYLNREKADAIEARYASDAEHACILPLRRSRG